MFPPFLKWLTVKNTLKVKADNTIDTLFLSNGFFSWVSTSNPLHHVRNEGKGPEPGNYVQWIIIDPFLPVKTKLISCKFNGVIRNVFIDKGLQAFGLGIG